MATKRCPECNKIMEEQYEPQWQEYAGAYPQPARNYFECECGYEEDISEEPIDVGNIQENKRGW